MKLGKPLPEGARRMTKEEYEEGAREVMPDQRDIVVQKMIERNKAVVEKLAMTRAYNDSIRKLTNEIDAILDDIEKHQLNIFTPN